MLKVKRTRGYHTLQKESLELETLVMILIAAKFKGASNFRENNHLSEQRNDERSWKREEGGAMMKNKTG